MRFVIFTHVLHRENKGRYYAYSPYVREMNLWFKYAEEVEILAPVSKGKSKTSVKTLRSGEPYRHLRFREIASFHLLSLPASIAAFLKMPVIFLKILRAMRNADHLHIRCPGNIG